MRLILISFVVLASLSTEAAPSCRQVFSKAFSERFLTRAQEQKIANWLRQTLKEGQYGPRIVTSEKTEVPDPERPFPLTLANGKQVHIMGVSGQQILVLPDLAEFVRGGLVKPKPITLLNQYGIPYGKEIDPKTGEPVPYVWNSSTWDVALAHRLDQEGNHKLVLLAGGMTDDPQTGRPLMMSEQNNMTRQRLFFDAEIQYHADGDWTLVGKNPRAPLNLETPQPGNWVKTLQQQTVFRHGYGGGPITLKNGDLYLDHKNRAVVVFEAIVDQKTELENGSVRVKAGRTAMFIAYLDPTLSHVLEGPRILLEPRDENGKPYQASLRNGYGELIEGGGGSHIEVQHQGRPVESMQEVRELRAQGKNLDFEMLGSPGEYYGVYGSFVAFAKGSIEKMKMVVDEKGQIDDFLKPLRVLFTWLGRPVSFYVEIKKGEDGELYGAAHGVLRSSLPEGINLDRQPEKPEHWPHFNRQILVFPLERTFENGQPKLRIRDNTGLIKFLEKFTPRRTSMWNFKTRVEANMAS